MGEYDRKQQKQESRAVAYNGGESRQLKGFVDNRMSHRIFQLAPASTDLYIRSDNAAGRRFNLRKETEYKLDSHSKAYTQDAAFSGGMSTNSEWKNLPFKEGKAVWKIASTTEMGELRDIDDATAVGIVGHHSIHLIDAAQKTKEEDVFKDYLQDGARGWTNEGKLYDKGGMVALGRNKASSIPSDKSVPLIIE